MSNRLPILAAEIAAEHAAVTAATKDFARHAVEAGNRLLEAKTLVDHGGWQDWLAEHVPDVSARTAQRYMRAAKRVSKNDIVSFSTLREILDDDDEAPEVDLEAWLTEMDRLWAEASPEAQARFRLAIEINGTKNQIPDYFVRLDLPTLRKMAAAARSARESES